MARLASILEKVGRKLPKAKPAQAHALIYDAFRVAALAGDTEAARRLLGAMYGRLPPAKKVVTALSTHAIDVYSHAAGLGDVTRGEPTFAYALVSGGAHADRVAAIERGVRLRVTANAYHGDYPTSDAWRKKPRSDAWYVIDRFRRVQGLVHPERATARSEKDALARMRELLSDWPAEERGAGMGSELAIAFDLAFRHGKDDREAAAWLAMHGHRLDEDVVETMMCLPAIAAKMVGGFFAAHAAVDRKALASVVAQAEKGGAAPAAPRKAPRVQKRKVAVQYAQVHLEPAVRTAAEAKQVFFQDRRESRQGMSLFPTMVGLATPSETEELAVEVVVGDKGKPALAGAVQAVAFPLTVRDGGVTLRGPTDDDDGDPLVIPAGAYDVLAVFDAPKVRKGGLRRFRLRLGFRDAGSLDAPRCYRLEEGKPPAKIW